MLRNIFCIAVALVWTALMFPLAALSIIFTFNAGSSMFVVRKMWSPVLVWAGGGQLEIKGLELLRNDSAYIFVSNHQSTIDIPVLFMAIPRNVRFVAKKELQLVPFIGWYMTLARFVFVDRKNHRDAVASLEAAGARIRSGVDIIAFPEGTRSATCEVLPFKKGPFAVALSARVPIIPVSIEGSGKLMPRNSWNITPGPIKVQFGAPIDSTQFGTDRGKLIECVRSAIIDLNVAQGGLGGNKRDAIAAKGREGLSTEEEE
jgi:1-acyl-sn-glycerol-3-phosphate acyltransferase